MTEQLRFKQEVGKIDGLSYRQADHWVNLGYVATNVCTKIGPNGRDVGAPVEDSERVALSGFVRTISDVELRVLRLMTRLVNAGFRVDIAAGLARVAAFDELPTLRLTGGLTLQL